MCLGVNVAAKLFAATGTNPVILATPPNLYLFLPAMKKGILATLAIIYALTLVAQKPAVLGKYWVEFTDKNN